MYVILEYLLILTKQSVSYTDQKDGRVDEHETLAAVENRLFSLPLFLISACTWVYIYIQLHIYICNIRTVAYISIGEPGVRDKARRNSVGRSGKLRRIA